MLGAHMNGLLCDNHGEKEPFAIFSPEDHCTNTLLKRGKGYDHEAIQVLSTRAKFDGLGPEWERHERMAAQAIADLW
jgi:hypothetical protein